MATGGKNEDQEITNQMVERFARMNCGSISELARRRSGSSTGGRRSSEDIKHKNAEG